MTLQQRRPSRKKMVLQAKLKNKWVRFWMKRSGRSYLGRLATKMAEIATPPYYAREKLSVLFDKGYISSSASIHHKNLRLGNKIFIGDRVLIFGDKETGQVNLGAHVHLYRENIVQSGYGGSITINDRSYIQPRCVMTAYLAPIVIGSNVQIAANCAFYSYNHSTISGTPIIEQRLTTKGGIFIEDDVWIGFGAIVLDGVRIGKGAVVGAGSVVTGDIPEQAMAAGNPARVIKMRAETDEKASDPLNLAL
jgi:acetyltransferase-like isoleucine patch superfamily enzyme